MLQIVLLYLIHVLVISLRKVEPVADGSEVNARPPSISLVEGGILFNPVKVCGAVGEAFIIPISLLLNLLNHFKGQNQPHFCGFGIT